MDTDNSAKARMGRIEAELKRLAEKKGISHTVDRSDGAVVITLKLASVVEVWLRHAEMGSPALPAAVSVRDLDSGITGGFNVTPPASAVVGLVCGLMEIDSAGPAPEQC